MPFTQSIISLFLPGKTRVLHFSFLITRLGKDEIIEDKFMVEKI